MNIQAVKMKRSRGGRGIVKQLKLERRRKKKKNLNEKESSASSSAGKIVTPSDDVLFEILLRLPARFVLRLRRVCKSWHSLTTDPSFVRKHTLRHCDAAAAAAGPKSVLIQYDPFLVPSPTLTLCVLNADVGCNRILRRIIKIPVKPEYLIDGKRDYGYALKAQLFCDGLLCFTSSRGPTPYYICNPITKTWTSVAESLHDRTDLIGFYFHRSTGEYRLLQCFREGKPAAGPVEVGYEVATVNRRENKSWRTVYERRYPSNSAVGSAEKLDRLLAAGIFCYEFASQFVFINEKLHWITFDKWNDDGILIFDTSNKKFRSISMPFKFHSPLPTLHEIRGSLCIGHGCPFLGRKTELWLLKDYNSEEWVKTHSLLSNQEITRGPSEGEEDVREEEGNLFKRWGNHGKHFSFYDLKHKTCCHTEIQQNNHFMCVIQWVTQKAW